VAGHARSTRVPSRAHRPCLARASTERSVSLPRPAMSVLPEKEGAKAPSFPRVDVLGSGFAAGEAHRRGAGPVVGLAVDKADHALLDLLPGALQGGRMSSGSSTYSA